MPSDKVAERSGFEEHSGHEEEWSIDVRGMPPVRVALSVDKDDTEYGYTLKQINPKNTGRITPPKLQ